MRDRFVATFIYVCFLTNNNKNAPDDDVCHWQAVQCHWQWIRRRQMFWKGNNLKGHPAAAAVIYPEETHHKQSTAAAAVINP